MHMHAHMLLLCACAYDVTRGVAYVHHTCLSCLTSQASASGQHAAANLRGFGSSSGSGGSHESGPTGSFGA